MNDGNRCFMLSDNFTLNDSAAAAKTFNLTYQSGTERRRLDTSSTLANPRTMRVIHATQGSGASMQDRHTVSFQKIVDDANGVPQTAIASLSLVVPRDPTAAAAITDLWTFVKNFLATTANVDAIIRGES